MPRGGWAHFEGGKGLTRIKHPCLHLGEGLSGRRDEKTPDLFEMMLQLVDGPRNRVFIETIRPKVKAASFEGIGEAKPEC